ncbi:hypothetical protein JVU11DRAFT_4186 [Chiua virens]|nr:hypothetical protein JVU11DRAFT_4186 [Chiua virens]
MATKPSHRLRALALYKELHRLGRDYEPSFVRCVRRYGILMHVVLQLQLSRKAKKTL